MKTQNFTISNFESVACASKGLEWLPVVGLVFFMVGSSVGFATVPFVLLGEMLPAKFRSTLGSVATAWNLTNTFLVIKESTSLLFWSHLQMTS